MINFFYVVRHLGLVLHILILFLVFNPNQLYVKLTNPNIRRISLVTWIKQEQNENPPLAPLKLTATLNNILGFFFLCVLKV